MKDNTKVTLIIPTYNREKTIGYCLQSVLNQTRKPDEIIISDDNSNDDTINLILKLNIGNLRILYSIKNTGAQAARNRGIKAAKYPWIAFLDSDDEWLPNTLETLVSKLSSVYFNPYTVVHSEGEILYTKTNERKLLKLPQIEGENVLDILLKKSGTMFQGMLTSKNALEKIGYLDENTPSHDEWETSLRLAQHCQFFYIKNPQFVYHWHEGDTISKNQLRHIQGYEYVIEKHKVLIEKICGKKTMVKHYYNISKSAAEMAIWDYSKKYVKKINKQPIREIFDLSVCNFFKIKPSYLQKRMHPPLSYVREIFFRLRFLKSPSDGKANSF